MQGVINEGRAYEIMESSAKLGKQKYGLYIESAKEEYYAANGRKMPLMMESAISNSLKATEFELRRRFGHNQVDSFLKSQYKKEAATAPSDIDSFINHAFTMITAMLPANPINEVCSMQSTDKRLAQIFFYDIVKGSTKGSHTAGDAYLSANDGPNTGKDYSNEKIDVEELYDGDGSTLAFSGAILSWRPIWNANDNYGDRRPILTYTIGSTTFNTKANSSNQFVDATNITTATINLTTGVLNVTFAGGKSPDADTKVSTTYYYDSAREDVSGVPEIITKFTETYVSTQPRRLNVKWMIDSALMASSEHGVEIEQEMVNGCLSGIMNEIAIEVFDDLYDVATSNGGAAVTFDKTPPSTTIPYITHKQEILTTLSEAGAEIEEDTQKVTANFVIGGKEFIKVTKGLPRDIFSPIKYADKIPVGAHVIGTLDNQYTVIQNFNYTSTKFLVGAKGPDWLSTGYIYVSYIPLMTTPVNWQESGAHWRQLLTYYGKKVVNGDFFVKGSIVTT